LIRFRQRRQLACLRASGAKKRLITFNLILFQTLFRRFKRRCRQPVCAPGFKVRFLLLRQFAVFNDGAFRTADFNSAGTDDLDLATAANA